MAWFWIRNMLHVSTCRRYKNVVSDSSPYPPPLSSRSRGPGFSVSCVSFRYILCFQLQVKSYVLCPAPFHTNGSIIHSIFWTLLFHLKIKMGPHHAQTTLISFVFLRLPHKHFSIFLYNRCNYPFQWLLSFCGATGSQFNNNSLLLSIYFVPRVAVTGNPWWLFTHSTGIYLFDSHGLWSSYVPKCLPLWGWQASRGAAMEIIKGTEVFPSPFSPGAPEWSLGSHLGRGEGKVLMGPPMYTGQSIWTSWAAAYSSGSWAWLTCIHLRHRSKWPCCCPVQWILKSGR